LGEKGGRTPKDIVIGHGHVHVITLQTIVVIHRPEFIAYKAAHPSHGEHLSTGLDSEAWKGMLHSYCEQDMD
jgi:hypothetical protein